MHLFLHFVWACLWMPKMFVYICASGRNNKSHLLLHGILILLSDTTPHILIAILCLEDVFSFPMIFFLIVSHIFLLSVHALFFFFADVLTDRVIALEADAWTQDDIARHHELIFKLGRISGIRLYMSYLIMQGGEKMCLWKEQWSKHIVHLPACSLSWHVCIVIAVFSLLCSHDT